MLGSQMRRREQKSRGIFKANSPTRIDLSQKLLCACCTLRGKRARIR